MQPLARRERPNRPGAGVRDDQDLARLDVALERGFHKIERARLRRDDVGVAEAAETERAKAVRVADRVQRVERQDHERVRALHLHERVGDLILERAGRRARQEVQDHLGVRVRLEDGAVALHVASEGLGIRQVAVVGDRDRPARGGRGDRLRVPEVRAPGGRVAHVPDGTMTRQPPQAFRTEDVRHPPHVLLGVERRAVGRRDARGLLPAMLQGVETEVRDVRGFRMVPDAEEPALVMESVVTPRDVQIQSSKPARVVS